MPLEQSALRIGLSSTARANKLVIHNPALSNHNIRCVGVVSRSRERAHQYVKNYEGLKIYNSFEDMIKSPEIDVIYISSPNKEHEILSLQALKAGKHVLCEKPLIISPSQLMKINQIAQDNNVLFMEAMHYPYHPIMNKFIHHVRSLDLTDIQRLQFYFDFPYPPEDDIRHQENLWGGTFAHLGCYITDILTRMFDDQICLQDLFCIRHPVGKADNFCMGTFQHKNQPHMKIDFRISFLTKTYKSYVILEDKKSNIFIENPFGGYVGKPITRPHDAFINEVNNDVFEKTTYDFQMIHVANLLNENQKNEVNILGNALFWQCWEELKTKGNLPVPHNFHPCSS
jgi:predicted dehydrogenase